MTWTLLGVMAIVQFSAKYLQCIFFFFFFFLLFILMLLLCEDEKHDWPSTRTTAGLLSCSCTMSGWFRWHNNLCRRPSQFWMWITLVMGHMLYWQAGCSRLWECGGCMSRDKGHMHCSNGLIRMKVVASEGTSRSFTVWRKCVLSQLIVGFVGPTRHIDAVHSAAPVGYSILTLSSWYWHCMSVRISWLQNGLIGFERFLSYLFWFSDGGPTQHKSIRGGGGPDWCRGLCGYQWRCPAWRSFVSCWEYELILIVCFADVCPRRACCPVQSQGMGGVQPQSMVPRPYYTHTHFALAACHSLWSPNC